MCIKNEIHTPISDEFADKQAEQEQEYCEENEKEGEENE